MSLYSNGNTEMGQRKISEKIHMEIFRHLSLKHTQAEVQRSVA